MNRLVLALRVYILGCFGLIEQPKALLFLDCGTGNINRSLETCMNCTLCKWRAATSSEHVEVIEHYKLG
jgi:hypothetical protein